MIMKVLRYSLGEYETIGIRSLMGKNGMKDKREMDFKILIYQSTEGGIKVDVHLEDETVWLTQAQMSVLFDKSKKNRV